MDEFLSLHDAEHIAEEHAPVTPPGYMRVFTGMIREPEKTLASAIAHPIMSYAHAFAAAGGVYWAYVLTVINASGAGFTLPVLLGLIVLLGIPAGVAYLYAAAIPAQWACEILGGTATRKQVRMALAYAGVPGILALALFGLPRLVLFGQSLFMPERAWMNTHPVISWVLWFGDALCFAWSVMLLGRAFKMMNRFSAARAAAALILPLGPIILFGLLMLAIRSGEALRGF